MQSYSHTILLFTALLTLLEVAPILVSIEIILVFKSTPFTITYILFFWPEVSFISYPFGGVPCRKIPKTSSRFVPTDIGEPFGVEKVIAATSAVPVYVTSKVIYP